MITEIMIATWKIHRLYESLIMEMSGAAENFTLKTT